MAVESEAESTEGSLEPVTVLLVDDDTTWARVTGRLLADNNDAVEVETAHTLQEGHDRFATLDPDCVVCDYELGDGTGLELLEIVRSTDPDRPFVLVTGRGDEAVASDAIGQGVTDYIRKDQDDSEAELLASRITKAVHSYRTERALERERRSKTAMLDILRDTAAETDLARRFCTHLVEERNYDCVWIGREAGDATPVPQAIDGRGDYLDAVHTPGERLPAGEPAQLALERNECVHVPVTEGETGSHDGSSWVSDALGQGFEAVLAVPISHGGVQFGVLAAYTDTASVIDERERRAIEEYAETVGYALTNAERKRSLVSASPVQVQVEIDLDSVPLSALTTTVDTTASVDLLSTVPRDDGTTLHVLEIAEPVASLEATLAGAESVVSVTVDSSVSPARCELVVSAPTPEDRLAAHGVLIEEAAIEGGTLRLSLTLPDAEMASTVQEVLDAEFEGGRVSNIWTDRDDDSPTTDEEFLRALTDRQREVLRHSLEVGYFERPRGTNATELSDHFGISRATFSQHLRTAQRKVLTRLFPGYDPE